MRLILVALFGTLCSGQTFESAAVYRSGPARYPSAKLAMRTGQVEVRTASLVDLIANAYGVEPDKVVGGPRWLEMERFDVVAKVPPGATQQSVRMMMRAMLANRFHLAIHMDQRQMPAFVLSTTGKPKLKQSDGSGPSGCQVKPQPGEATVMATCRALTMDALAQQLRTGAGDYLMNPVINETKLDGAWDFMLQWTPRGRLAAAGAVGITIFDAVEKQLGLKLDAKRAPAPVVVVASVVSHK